MVDRRRQFDLCREEARRVAVAISRLPELLAMERALKVGEPGEDDTLATFKRKPPDLPPEVGRRLIADMHAFYAEPDKNMADEIASGILHMLREHYREKLRMSDIKDLFEAMRDKYPPKKAATKRKTR